MKSLILANSRFKNLPIVSRLSGSGNAGHGGYVKKDIISDEGKGSEGAGMNMTGIKKKLKPLKFKM